MVKKDIAFFLHFPKVGTAKTKETNPELDHMRWLARVAKGRDAYLSRHRDEYRTFALQQYFGSAQTTIPWVMTGGQVSVTLIFTCHRQVNVYSCATVFSL